ncbi:MAG TPA: serine/threonine-protein kinase [Longimicrobium sp.]|nr:serine/threonine-protein kinase [Longimicrobium sp.]
MPAFEPAANETFSLALEGRDLTFRALEHPFAPGFVHAAEGAKAIVYRIEDIHSGGEYAIKVMKQRFRDPSLEVTCQKLDQFKTLDGMGVCERRCLSPASAPKTLQRYPNLEYAILMPWVQGLSWFDMLAGGGQTAVLNREECLDLALRLAGVLAGLEERGIAHCDLSAANVIVDPRTLQPSLIDVEDIYADVMQPPSALTLGTPGYQHRTSMQGVWRIDGDRFAGAVLIAEMLGWYDDEVRAASYGETYFDPSELQMGGSERLRMLQHAIGAQGRAGSPASRAVSNLLEQAWNSVTLQECPTLGAWREALARMRMGLTFSPLPAIAPKPQVSPFWKVLPEASQKRLDVRWITPTQAAPERKPPVVLWGAPQGSAPAGALQTIGNTAPAIPDSEEPNGEPI